MANDGLSDNDLARRFGEEIDERPARAPPKKNGHDLTPDGLLLEALTKPDQNPNLASAPTRGILTWPQVLDLPESKPLVKGLLDLAAFSVLYGAANCGKTFLSLDLGLHVALGWPWRGHIIKQRGTVLYIAAEGGLGIRQRLQAFQLKYNIDPSETDFLIFPAAIDLCTDINPVLELIEQIKARPEFPIVLIIIDTLSRTMAGANENASEDMSAFVNNCDTLRRETGAHVMVVHHTGKDTERGARGHSALRAAVDTEIEVSREDGSDIAIAKVTKQRDMRGGDNYPFKLELIELGQDDDGDAITSCIVDHLRDEDPAVSRRNAKKPKPQKFSPAATLALRCLHDALDKGAETPPSSIRCPQTMQAVRTELWKAHCLRAGISDPSSTEAAQRKAFYRAKLDLVAAQAVGEDSNWCWCIPRTQS